MSIIKHRKFCAWCEKPLPQPNIRTDGFCTAKCKRKSNNDFYRVTSRPCDPDHGWF